MKNKKVISIVLGGMCFALTLGICIQIKTVTGSNSIVGESNRENDELRAEVLRYKERYDNIYKDLERAEKELEKERQNATQNNGDLEEKEEAIKQGNKMIGMTEVTGPGVIVTLSDGKKDTSTVLNASDLIVHDADVLSVINELKNAGAEAISINDQRIVTTTAITCDGNVVRINNEKVGTPFEIKAIGSPEAMEGALLRPGGYIKEYLEADGIHVTVKKVNNVTIPKYNGVINWEYAKTIE